MFRVIFIRTNIISVSYSNCYHLSAHHVSNIKPNINQFKWAYKYYEIIITKQSQLKETRGFFSLQLLRHLHSDEHSNIHLTFRTFVDNIFQFISNTGNPATHPTTNHKQRTNCNPCVSSHYEFGCREYCFMTMWTRDVLWIRGCYLNDIVCWLLYNRLYIRLQWSVS